MTEQQVAEHIDKAGDNRQPEQQRRERALPAGATRNDHLSDLIYELT